MRVAIVDYGNGNFGSLIAALNRLDISPAVWTGAHDVKPVDAIFFPGVGALGEVRHRLKETGLLAQLDTLRTEGTPILGICLGLQLFFGAGDEGGQGLEWLSGTVPSLKAPILPHIGWNTVDSSQKESVLMRGLGPQPAFYFVHEYYVKTTEESVVKGYTEYGTRFPSIIEAPPLYGVQFHPELSGKAGQTLLENFLEGTR